MFDLIEVEDELQIQHDDDLLDVPLVLAGPILRRVEPDSVTVWIALHTSRTVTLEVRKEDGTAVLSGSRDTVEFGKYLHVVAVTATQESGSELQSGMLYSYDLEFGSGESLSTDGVLTTDDYDVSIGYDGNDLPQFSLPPADLDDLRVIQSSCRKPHGGGTDALPGVDAMLRESSADPNARPHLLCLTGDQIYADDVAEVILERIRDVAPTLVGWEEEVPYRYQYNTPDGHNLGDVEHVPLSTTFQVTDDISVSPFDPGERADTARETFGLSSAHAESHVFGLAEYYALYLLSWSDVFIPDEESPLTEDLDGFVETLPVVRRALANVPTYMIFDDHDVTDDWNLNGDWIRRVYDRDGDLFRWGRFGDRIVQNGLAAYAVFQAWGNTPWRFPEPTGSDNPPGTTLLSVLSPDDDYENRTDIDDRSDLDDLLGLPVLPESSDDPVRWLREDGVDSIRWDYTVSGPGFEVLVLDIRTWRSYPVDDHREPPDLLPREACDEQLPPQTDGTQVTIVVSPMPLWIHPVVKDLQDSGVWMGELFGPVGDWIVKILRGQLGHAWNADEVTDNEGWDAQMEATDRLYAELATRDQPETGDPARVVVLSGEIHHGMATGTSYWARDPYEQSSGPATAKIVCFTASGAKNKTQNTTNIGTDGYDWQKHLIGPLRLGFPEESSIPGSDPPAYVWRGSASEETYLLEALEDVDSPEWLYRVDYVEGVADTTRDRVEDAMYSKMSKEERDKVLYYRAQLDTVGRNNIGEITFDLDSNTVYQHLWWWVSSDPDIPEPVQQEGALDGIAPVTKYEQSLDTADLPLQVDGSYPADGDDDTGDDGDDT